MPRAHRTLLLAGLFLAGPASAVFAAETLVAAPQAPSSSSPAAAADADKASPRPVTQLAPVRVVASSDHTVSDVTSAQASSNLLAPCMLITKDLASGRQLQALGAPLKPMQGDPPSTVLQAHFPLVSLAW